MNRTARGWLAALAWLPGMALAATDAASSPPQAQSATAPAASSALTPTGAPPAQDPETALPWLLLPRVGLKPSDLAVVVNDADPTSVEVGRYYASRRGLPVTHLIHVRFTPGQPVMSEAEFEQVQAQLRRQVPATVQAYALAWTQPYRVECMSVTSAFAFGFDRAYCAQGCALTRASPYFDSPSHAPFSDHGLRPAMLLAGVDMAGVKALIERGLRAEGRWPAGTGYLLSTSDAKRNGRAASFPGVERKLAATYPIRRLQEDVLQDRRDVMFYFTGVARVKHLASNRFVDGALGDHLTSAGGMLGESYQTNALEWLAAGATGSYGNTIEPCNYLAKFPHVGVVMRRYLGGETLIEAYWKSVLMPGQGVFVGDPLARPFGGVRMTRAGDQLLISTRLLGPGRYLLQQAASGVGPFRTTGALVVPAYGVQELRLPVAAGFVRVEPVGGAAWQAAPLERHAVPKGPVRSD